MDDAQTWGVALYNGARDNKPKVKQWTAAALVRNLCRMNVWTRAKVDAPAWSPVVLVDPDGRRSKGNVAAVTCLVLDCDSGDALETIEACGDEFVRVGHTSWSHTKGHVKARAVYPFEVPCPAEHWGRVWAAAAAWAASQGVTIDGAAKDSSRLYFGPFVPDDVVAREEWEAWVYGPAETVEGAGGILPCRPRRLLSWSWLLSNWEPEEEHTPAPPPPLAGVGSSVPMPEGEEERMQWRRERFAERCVDKRAHILATMGQGGRNKSLYGAARMVRGLEVAGALRDAGGALAALEQAALSGGLSAREVRLTIHSGYNKGHGDTDGAFPIEDYVHD